MKIKLSENIQELRKRRGITQSELAEVLSVTPQTVSRWENGQSYPDIEQLPALAAYFDITLDDLMGTSDLVYQKLLEELHQTRIALQKEEDAELRKEHCRILKKLADIRPGTHAIPYFGAIMRLYKSGYATERQVEEARKRCEKCLADRHTGDRPHLLAQIIVNETDENIDRWRHFISQDGIMSTWGDVMLTVYRGKSLDQWEKQRQENIFSRIWCALNLLVLDKQDNLVGAKYDSNDPLNPVEQYEAALQTLNVFSKEDDDVFLPMRIFIENRYMKALFANGRNEDGFVWMEKLSTHARMLAERTGEKRNGSVPFLALKEESDVPRDAEAHSSISDICNAEHHRAFDAVRDDPRFVQFYIQMHTFIKFDDKIPFAFAPLIESAKNELQNVTVSKGTQIVSVQTAKGNIYHLIQDIYSSYEAKELAFVKDLKAKNDAAISKIVCIWANGVSDLPVDVPSYHLRELLFKADKQNRNALVLLQGMKKLIVKKVIDFFPQEKKI